ncbi:MAG: AAA family ATPase [Taibaiella sp.]|nr:AAA family ATPase [Taibaiella sp.]
MEPLIGRYDERELLENALTSASAELIAVYGRRRVGKTFLIRSVFAPYMAFECTGIHGATLKAQLQNFTYSLQKALKTNVIMAVPKSWLEAFQVLESYLQPIIEERRAVVFFDEFPWIHTPKSDFLGAFSHFWNHWASRHPHLTVVICGSAASWLITNVVNSKGGLHNRVTLKLRLEPFTLKEAELYLKANGAILDRYQVLQLYMVMGGIPHYLKMVRPGESAAQAVERTCFAGNGMLRDEFGNLYSSLFANYSNHVEIIKVLSKKTAGLTRNEIIKEIGMNTGGTVSKILTELEESGFIKQYVPFGRTVKYAVYRLIDEYSVFYLKYIDKKSAAPGSWLRVAESASWHNWSGFAFESVCLKHIGNIKKALGIAALYTEESVWRQKAEPEMPGVQTDLLIDRADYCINVCEMKFSTGEFTITKSYAAEIAQKQNSFKARTKTRKALFFTMITTYGVTRNIYYTGHVLNEVKMDALFE